MTLKQLQDAAFIVQNRERNTALAEMFSVELKLTVDCLKFWFDKTHKINNLEVKLEDKLDFTRNYPKNSDIVCCLCDFSIEAQAPNGWSHHVFKAEDLFLENIYSEQQMKIMGIDKFEVYSKKLDKILDDLEPFCESIEREVVDSLIKGQKDPEVEAITAKIQKMKTGRVCYDDENRATREKTIAFLYQHALCFLSTNMVEVDFPMSEKFLYNMIAVFNNKHFIHHSHVTGKILGYAHEFCNERVRENYYTIPTFVHNQLRFHFFLFFLFFIFFFLF